MKSTHEKRNRNRANILSYHLSSPRKGHLKKQFGAELNSALMSTSASLKKLATDSLICKGGGPVTLGFNHSPPLSRRIIKEPLPNWFKMPQVDPYYDTSNPLGHLKSYKSLMTIQGTSDVLLCIAFSTTLCKVALV